MTKFFVRTPEVGLMGFALDEFFLEEARPRPGRPQPYVSQTDPSLFIADLEGEEADALQERGAEVFVDVEFDTFGPERPPGVEPPELTEAAVMAEIGLRDVLQQIRAPEAWERSRGAGVTIAVVDTGVCGSLAEFPTTKRSPFNPPSTYSGQHWSDLRGHGSMCAAIAAATSSQGGRFDGVAPDASVLSARTSLQSTDIYRIYDSLVAAVRKGQIAEPLVISNSYGLYTCQPPNVLPQNHPYAEIVFGAVDDGIPVVFAAGNNHFDVLCQHDPAACGPNTIWAVNSADRVLSVGTVDSNGSNQDPANRHANSSRGPGEWAQELPKPDCVAPTFGQVVWGCGYRNMSWWGTSGACPQVAGLAALMLAVDPKLTPRQIGDIIRGTCRPLGAAPPCVGHGMIDCAAAVAAV